MITTVNFLTERIIVAVGWAILAGFLWFLLSFYLFFEWRDHRADWTERLGTRAGFAIWVYMLGETINRAWGAALIIAFAFGTDIGVLESRYPVALFGALVGLVGLLMKIRIFTPDGWGSKLWATSGIVAIAISIGIALFTR